MKKLIVVGLVALWALLLFLYFRIPEYEFIPTILHFSVYGLLTLSAMHLTRATSTWTRVAICIVIMAIGLFDETLQVFFPSRTPSLYDVGVDYIGVVVAFTSYHGVKLLKSNQKAPRIT